MPTYRIERKVAFVALFNEYSKEHRGLENDLEWIEGRLRQAPSSIGDQITGLKHLPFPIFKTRCKDSCHGLGARAAWRIYYAVDESRTAVHLLFLHHRKEYENPGKDFLRQKMDQAFAAAVKSKR